MNPSHRPNSPCVRLTGAVRGVILAALVVGSAFASPPVFASVPVFGSAGGPVAASGPQLSIAIANGRTSAAAGDKLTYAVTVRNLGANVVTGLSVSQTMPTGLKLVSADSGGKANAGKVHWQVNLEVAATATFHTTMTVVATPRELLRLASVACATLVPDGAPIVCAAHSDQLPAGAAFQSARGGSDHTWWWYVGGGIGLLVVIALAALLLARRRAARIAEQRVTL